MHRVLVFTFPILILILLRKYREYKWGKCKNTVRLDNKIVIITGANSGLGLETAKELAARNAHVIMACRNLERAREACIYINKTLSFDPVLIPMELDLASLQSVRKFVEEIKQRYRQIHILINNAGVSYPDCEHRKTEDGYEIHFGVNHLGHFFLTNELLDLLIAGSARVIIVSSSLHEKGAINIGDLNCEHIKPKASSYANSKLANLYFGHQLAERTTGKINVYICSPGWVYTNLFRHSLKWYHYFLVLPLAFFFMRTPNQGAQTIIYCATEPVLEQETGLLYRDCKHYNTRAIMYNNISMQLWDKSEEMVIDALKERDAH